MAALEIETAAPPDKVALEPQFYDRILASAAVLLLGAVAVALGRGQSEWARLPLLLWAHIGTIVVALALTPIMLLRRRGDRLHRQLGWCWSASLAITAASTFGIRGMNGGALSFIHVLSAWTLIQVPLIVWSARTHQVARHRRAVRVMATGALIIAGIFTFPFDRLMGRWLFS